MRTRMSGGVGGERRTNAAPYPDLSKKGLGSGACEAVKESILGLSGRLLRRADKRRGRPRA